MNKKRICLIGLTALVILILFLIYPSTPHQRLFDSTNYHVEAYLLIKDGRAIWNLSPLSLFGIYPITATGPMGSIYFLSSLSISTGVPIEPSILLMNGGISVFLVLSAFILAKKVFNNKLIALFTTFFFCSARITLIYQEWTATPRGFIAGFLPMLIFLLISIYTKEKGRYVVDKKYLGLFILILLTMSTVHRSIALAIPGFVAFFLYLKYQSRVKDMISRFRHPFSPSDTIYRFYKLTFISTIFFLLIVLSISVISGFFGYPQFLQRSIILSSRNPFLQAINMLYYLSRKFGIGMIFAAMGFVTMSLRTKNRLEVFIFLAMLALIPLSIQRGYVYPIWAVYLSLLAGYGFYRFLKYIGKDFLIVITISAIIFITIVGAPFFITISEPHQIEHQRKIYVTDQEVETAYSIRSFVKDDESFFVDPVFSSTRLSAFSGRCSLGLKGIEEVWMNKSIKEQYIIEPAFQRDVSYSLDNIYREKGALFYIANDPVLPERSETRGWGGRIHYVILANSYKEEQYNRIVNAYNLKMIVIDEQFIEDREYVDELNDGEYTLYNNGRYSFYPISY